jgi:phage-related protein
VTTIKFGDGYEQRRPTGLNHQLINFQPVFRITSDNSRTALEAFLAEHGGYKAFLWRPPKYNRTIKVVCRNGLLRTTSRILISAVNLSRLLLKDPYAGYSSEHPQRNHENRAVCPY